MPLILYILSLLNFLIRIIIFNLYSDAMLDFISFIKISYSSLFHAHPLTYLNTFSFTQTHLIYKLLSLKYTKFIQLKLIRKIYTISWIYLGSYVPHEYFYMYLHAFFFFVFINYYLIWFNGSHLLWKKYVSHVMLFLVLFLFEYVRTVSMWVYYCSSEWLLVSHWSRSLGLVCTYDYFKLKNNNYTTKIDI